LRVFNFFPVTDFFFLAAQFVYVESWKAIELANGIFGFNGWSSSIVEITPDFVRLPWFLFFFFFLDFAEGLTKKLPHQIDEVQGKFRVGITAVVRVTLKDGTSHEDVGFGIGENRIKGEAIQKAKKEAVSDARKRALRLFGNGLGNTIYDREYTMVIKRTQSQKQKGVLPSVTYDALRSGAVLLNHEDHATHHSKHMGHSNGAPQPGPMNVGHPQHNNSNSFAQPNAQAPQQQQRPPVPQQQHSVQPPQQMVYQPQPSAQQQQYPPHMSGPTLQFEGEIDDSSTWIC
jgi:DNA repair and recombination protein RAD52